MKIKKIIGWSLLVITVVSALAAITLGLMIKYDYTLFVSLLMVIGGTSALFLLTWALTWAVETVLE
jgi:uncharacterized protein (DUF697 family)